MFTQVYFHKTRVAYDLHLKGALRELLPGGQFPVPTGKSLEEFLTWDDWRVLGLLSEGHGGEHGSRLRERNHYRRVYASPEISSEADFSLVERIKAKLAGLLVAAEESKKNWYNTGQPDIPVVSNVDTNTVLPLSKYSNVVLNMKPINQVLLYSLPENAEKGKSIVKEVLEYERNRQNSFGFAPDIS